MKSETMRAIVQTGIGGHEVMELKHIALPPAPVDDQVMIRITACGVCYHDVLVRNGIYRKFVELPLVPGHELAGDVIAVGSAVTRIKVGDQIASTNRETCGHCDLCRTGNEGMCPNQKFFGHNSQGGYAEYAVVRENALSVVPRSISPELACTLFCTAATELHAIRRVGEAKAGETVLITGAGGGLGIHGVQIAKLSGCFTVGLTTSPEKVELIRNAGADEVVLVDRKAKRYEKELLAVAPNGYDVICDNVGEPVFESAFRALATLGRYVFVGQLNNRPISFNPAWLLFRGTSLRGSNSATRKELDEVIAMTARGQIKPVIDLVMPIADACKAHARVETATATGRVVLVP